MAYLIDGSSHRDGIRSEDKSIKLMQMDSQKASAICGIPLATGEYEVEKRGGTKYKEDMVIRHRKGEVKVSHKRKKKLSTGSFDWLNSTKRVPEAGTLKSLTISLRKASCSVAYARKAFNVACNEALESLQSSDVIQIIKEGIIAKYDSIDRITIEAQNEKTIYSFKPADLPLFRAVSQPGTRVELHGRGKTSRRLRFFDKAGNPLPDYGLRLRVTSNNGITAMLGINPKGKNNTSSPVIKLQQDKVHKMIAGIEPGDLTKTRI